MKKSQRSGFSDFLSCSSDECSVLGGSSKLPEGDTKKMKKYHIRVLLPTKLKVLKVTVACNRWTFEVNFALKICSLKCSGVLARNLYFEQAFLRRPCYTTWTRRTFHAILLRYVVLSWTRCLPNSLNWLRENTGPKGNFLLTSPQAPSCNLHYLSTAWWKGLRSMIMKSALTTREYH